MAVPDTDVHVHIEPVIFIVVIACLLIMLLMTCLLLVILCRYLFHFFPRDAMQAWPIPSVTFCVSVCHILCVRLSHSVCPSVCLSVRPSVTFVNSVKTNKHICKFFSSSGSHTTPVFLYQTSQQYSAGNPPTQRGVECKLGLVVYPDAPGG